MNAPIQDIIDIVKAMLLILGATKAECKDWKNMRGVIGRTGKESLKRKIIQFDINNVAQNAHERAMVLMSGVELDRVTKGSSSVSIFYAFVRGALTMLNAEGENFEQKEAEAKLQRQREKEEEEERLKKEEYDKEAADRQVAETLKVAKMRRKSTKRITRT